MEAMGEMLEAPRLVEETTNTQKMEDNLVLTTLGKGPRGHIFLGEGGALEDKKKLDEYPFKCE